MKGIIQKGYLELPAEYRPVTPYTDALDDLYIRVTDLINFTGEVIVSRELSKDLRDENLEIKPKLHLIHRARKNIEFPTIKMKARKWSRLAKQLPEQLFYSSITRMATIYETYLSEIFHEILLRHPKLIIEDERQLTTEEIFQHQSLDEIKRTLIEKKVHALLFGSYPKMVRSISSLLKIEFHGSKSPMSLFEVHDFIETRNVIIHNDGVAGHLYFERMSGYENEPFIKDKKSKRGYVDIDYNWFFKYAENFLSQCSFIDEQLTKKWKSSKGE